DRSLASRLHASIIHQGNGDTQDGEASAEGGRSRFTIQVDCPGQYHECCSWKPHPVAYVPPTPLEALRRWLCLVGQRQAPLAHASAQMPQAFRCRRIQTFGERERRGQRRQCAPRLCLPLLVLICDANVLPAMALPPADYIERQTGE